MSEVASKDQAAEQKQKQEDHAEAKPSDDANDDDNQARTAAARLIQSNYRGYRTRRELDGNGLDANSRWSEAFKSMRLDDARQQQLGKKNVEGGYNHTDATSRWKRGGLLVGQIAGSPGCANDKDDVKGADPSAGPIGSDGPVDGGPSLHERGEEGNDQQDGLPGGGKPDKPSSDGKVGSDIPGAYDGDKIDNVKRIAKPNQHGLRLIEWWTRGAASQDLSKTMEAAYWLEMVDRKHRYGSNLKPYHAAWSEADTKQNFFVWLDEGEGKDLDLPDCPRERLEGERIDYLSADQRKNYIVDIKDGKLYWRRNGKPVDTTKNKYRDLGGGQGIVELGPEEQAEQERLRRERRQHRRMQAGSSGSLSSMSSMSSGSSSSSSDSSDSEAEAEEKEEAAHYGADLSKKKKRIGMLSSKGWMDAMLRKTVQANTWIYVLNSRRELYVGIKQTGKFQHSSFLYGGRVLSAGLLKVRDGTLTSLSPLSGHYRAGTAHFRHFIYLLQQEGVDLDHVTLSKSLLLLRGMEAYGTHVKKKGKKKDKGDKKGDKGGGEAGENSGGAPTRPSTTKKGGEDSREGLRERVKNHLHRNHQEPQQVGGDAVPAPALKQGAGDHDADADAENRTRTSSSARAQAAKAELNDGSSSSAGGASEDKKSDKDRGKTLLERIRSPNSNSDDHTHDGGDSASAQGGSSSSLGQAMRKVFHPRSANANANNA